MVGLSGLWTRKIECAFWPEAVHRSCLPLRPQLGEPTFRDATVPYDLIDGIQDSTAPAGLTSHHNHAATPRLPLFL